MIASQETSGSEANTPPIVAERLATSEMTTTSTAEMVILKR
jgi:hypothetical protein